MIKILKITIALLAVLVLSATLSSCEKQNPAANALVYYTVEGDIKNGGLYSLAEYTTAISKAVGNGAVKPDDAKVIAACQEVYDKHKQTYSKISGYVEIFRKQDAESTVIKKFTY